MSKIIYNRACRSFLANYLKQSRNHVHSRLFGCSSKSMFERVKSSHSSKVIPSLLAFTLAYAYSEPKDEERQLLEQADKLFDSNKLEEMISLLKSLKCWEENNEVLWRIARCNYHQLKYRTDKGSQEYMSILEDSFSLVEKSLKINDKCGSAYKWAAIILDEYSTAQGTKARIANLLRIKEFMEKAIEFSPHDPTAYYLLGEWHYGCSSVTWVERNLANLFFGSLPEASYELALELFERAEKIQPEFYSKNQIMIAKTLLALNREKDRATNHLKSIVNKYKGSVKWADTEAYKEATQLLNKMGEKVPE